jgi:hypothetical protein
VTDVIYALGMYINGYCSLKLMSCFLLFLVYVKVCEVVNETGNKILLLLLPGFEPQSSTSYCIN